MAINISRGFFFLKFLYVSIDGSIGLGMKKVFFLSAKFNELTDVVTKLASQN